MARSVPMTRQPNPAREADEACAPADNVLGGSHDEALDAMALALEASGARLKGPKALQDIHHIFGADPDMAAAMWARAGGIHHKMEGYRAMCDFLSEPITKADKIKFQDQERPRWIREMPEIQADPSVAFHAAELPNLESVPKFSGSSFWLDDCPKLARLGPVQVARDLHLDRCTSLVKLPEELTVGRNLYLRGCTAWDGIIPSGATIKGRVYTDKYRRGVTVDVVRAEGIGLSDLVKDVHDPSAGICVLMAAGAGFGAVMDITACKFGQAATMEAFGDMEGLVIPGDVDCCRREWVDRLPKNCTVEGNLKLSWSRTDARFSSRVQELPDGLTVKGDLIAHKGKINPQGVVFEYGVAEGENSIRRIGQGVCIHGDADLTGSALTAIPSGTSFGGDVCLLRNLVLESIGEGVTFGGDFVAGSPAFKNLPADMAVAGTFRWEGFGDGFTFPELPAGFRVGKDFSVPRDLHTLPDDLKVGRDLILDGGRGRIVWPSRMQVGGMIAFGIYETQVLTERGVQEKDPGAAHRTFVAMGGEAIPPKSDTFSYKGIIKTSQAYWDYKAKRGGR